MFCEERIDTKKIVVDAMGGDNTPKATIEGVNRALAEFSDIEIQLYGDEPKIEEYPTVTERVSIIHTEEKISSNDEPAKAIRRKKKTSMVLGAQTVKKGTADAVISAGNTGTLLAAGLSVAGRIKSIDRPGFMSTLPTLDGKGYDMLDLGTNTESTPKHLHQYAILRSFYTKDARDIAKPRVGLLNNGTEATKGDPFRKEAYALLAEDASLNSIGNVEACDLMDGVADAVVSGDFTGNAVLKTMEGTALNIMGGLKSSTKSSDLKARLGALLLKDSLYQLKGIMDYSNAGDAVLFGLKAPVVRCYGSSDAQAIYYTIRQVRTMLETNVVGQLVEAFTPKN